MMHTHIYAWICAQKNALPLFNIFRYNSKLEKCKDTHSEQTKKGNGFPTSVTPVSTTCHLSALKVLLLT